ncbi:MAG: toxin-antitoxin system protein [Lachnospiraceae bacterium]|nr:toxin-antitoxin system protein [Lachnospiraceae bacterium]
MKPLKAKISITIDTDIIEEVKYLAEKDDRSLSQYINLVLKEYLKNKKQSDK